MLRKLLCISFLIFVAISAHAGTATAILCPHSTQNGNLANCGLSPLVITGATNAAPIVFSVGQNPQLAGYQTGETFTVTNASPSAYNGTFTIGSLNSTTVTATNASAPGSAWTSDGSISALPGTATSLTFGKQGTSTASMAIPISVSNCSTADFAPCTGTGSLTLGATPFSISGTNASDFVVANGTCSANQVIASGAYCSPTVTFTPTATAGTIETATLTVADNGLTTSQKMYLTGVSATVTTLSACGSQLAANTNYQLTQDVNASQSCFTTGSHTNWDLNLNGHTITYCTTPSTSIVAAILYDNFNVANGAVHNGKIVESGTNTCTGQDSIGYGSGIVRYATAGSGSATSMFNLSLSQNDANGKILLEYGGSLVHDIDYIDQDTVSCNNTGCRAESQATSIFENDQPSYSPSTFYNITGTGGAQSGITSAADGTVYEFNYINPGNTVSTVTNGFIYQAWGPNQIVAYNLTGATGCISCRGVQLANPGNSSSAGFGMTAHDNVLHVTNLANNAEYGGCQLDGAYGAEYDFPPLGNNPIQNNRFYVTAAACPGFGMSYSSGDGNPSINKTTNNIFECDLTSGTSIPGLCAGAKLDNFQYTPHPSNAFGSLNDQFYGDTSALWIGYDGNSSVTFNGDTFGTGTHPMTTTFLGEGRDCTGNTSPLFIDFNRGCLAAGSNGPFTIVNATFTGGLTKDKTNLSTWASNNPTASLFYIVKWSYGMVVERSSDSSKIAGASITIVDSTSATECTGTTNASGGLTCTVNDTKYAATSGTYSTLNYYPLTVTISATGCTTDIYNKTVLSKVTDTIKLSGC